MTNNQAAPPHGARVPVVRAAVDPRTIARCLCEDRVGSTHRARIEVALKKMENEPW